jgi:hypothetical protein
LDVILGGGYKYEGSNLRCDLRAFASQSELGRYYDDAATKTDGNILQKPIIR